MNKMNRGLKSSTAMQVVFSYTTNDAADLARVIKIAADAGMETLKVGRKRRERQVSSAQEGSSESAPLEESTRAEVDAILVPAAQDGMEYVNTKNAWRSPKISPLKEEKIVNRKINRIYFYEAGHGAPQAVTHVAEIDRLVPTDNPALAGEPRRFKIILKPGSLHQLARPIPAGGVILRSKRYVNSGALLKAKTLADIMA